MAVPGVRALQACVLHRLASIAPGATRMEKLTWFTVLICAALAACDPRSTPQKPKTGVSIALAFERSEVVVMPIAGERD
jgi:hypothetical protein